MRSDLERELLVLVGNGGCPREIAEKWILEGKIATSKQMWATLEKWCRKNWYEHGVTLDLGWLTLQGKAELKARGGHA